MSDFAYIPPMLATRLAEASLPNDRQYAAEPKLDGQRAQLHVQGGRTVRCYSRRGLDLLRHRGLAWLKSFPWPVDAAVLDGEVFAGNGCDGIDGVFAARDREDGATAVAVFDVLRLDGASVLAQPWEERRRRLEKLFQSIEGNRVQLVPVSDDAKTLWDAWVDGYGGEGIVLKDRNSVYRPGIRSLAWLKAKQRLTLEVLVTEAAEGLVEWGDWGRAAMLTFVYQHPAPRRKSERPAGRPGAQLG